MSQQNDQSLLNCKKCLLLMTEEQTTVSCLQCKDSYHHECVRINEHIENWVCPTCTKTHLKVPPAPSVKGSSHRSKTSSKIRLFEEQKRLLEEQERLLASEIEMKRNAAAEETRLYKEMIENQRKSSEDLQKTLERRKEILNQKSKLIDETIISVSGSSHGSIHSEARSKEKVQNWFEKNSQLMGDDKNKSMNSPMCSKMLKQHPSSTMHNVNPHSNVNPLVTNHTSEKQADNAETQNSMNVGLSKNQIAARQIIRQLPTFDGNPKEWARFVSSFERSTDLCGFSNDENLERLRQSLRGNALEAVEGRLSSGMVSSIISDLKNLFGRPEFIINELVKNLRGEPNPSLDNIDSIIRYSFQVENICVSMRDAQLSEYLWDPNLLKEMEGKLPIPIKLDWATYKHSSKMKANFEVFSMWLKERTNSYMSVLTNPPNLLRVKSKSKGYTNVHDSTESCPVCEDGDHILEKCQKFQNLTVNDKWIEVKKNSLCRQCLKYHKSRKCSKNILCNVDGCQLRHHSILHNSERRQTNEENNAESEVNIHSSHSDKTYFKILPVRLCNGPDECIIHAILDDCSSVTLLDRKVANVLNARGESMPLCLKWTNGVSRREDLSQVVNLQISPVHVEKKYQLQNVRTVDDLCLPMQSINMEELKSCYRHLKDVPFQSYENVRPQLLIGLKHSKLHEVSKYCSSGNGCPAACHTPLGWVVYGGGNSEHESSVHHVSECNCSSEADARLETMVRENYSLESIGVSNPKNLPISTSDERAYEILKSTVNLRNKRFEVGLLWKYDEVKLPKSYQMAFKRQQCLERRSKVDRNLPEIIEHQIEEYVKKKYASELSEWSANDNNCWYLPIFIVRNPNKPNKIRLVWDAAATVGGISLNTVLLKGPDLVSSLPSVLQRFRQYEFAISGDIREMFHQVEIRAEDRQYQRFLWRKSPNDEMRAFVMNVMTFGASCSPACAQYVKNENAKRFRLSHPNAVDAIISNHYVDDWLESVTCIEDAVALAEAVKYVHAEGGFEVRNWMSNSKKVMKDLQGFTNDIKSLDISPTFEGDKVLGMFWKTTFDTFVYQLNFHNISEDIMNSSRIPTKREVLKLLMSVFDPLGLISHVLIFLKVLMQRIWRSNVQWDQEITQENFELWKVWMNTLPSIKKLDIPRWIGLKSFEDKVEMHTFTDASEDAYAAVVYFKIFSGDGIKCSLITSKSRVAPLKALSVPRLELQAAILGTRLAKTVESNHNHKITKRFFWTDSQTVIQWIHSDTRKYTQFVSCRIGEILESSSSSEWKWIEGKQNVADLATKMRIPEISIQTPWFKGPDILMESENHEIERDVGNTSEELRTQFVCIHEEVEFRIEKWTRLRRVVAFVARYVKNLYCKCKKLPLKTGPIDCEEYKNAERILLLKAQKEGFPEEYHKLESGSNMINRKSVIYKDSPYIGEDGLIRSRSRIGEAPYTSFDVRRPIILPKENRITDMLLHFYHERYYHRFPKTVLNEVKQRFAISGLRVKLTSIRRSCQTCKNSDAKPQVPEEAELPAARLTAFTRPFTFIGIDYFGPTHVVVGRRHEKRWCMLITCLTTRALHLEVAHTLTTNSCILGLRRFISRRGAPKEIYSDNGTNFRGSKRELREIWEQIDKTKVAESFIDSETEWKFIPPASPHMGGAWERMVRTVKTSLKASLPSLREPTDELLLTMLAEVENMINSRPLTYVSLRNEDEEALTPNHFILGSTSGMKPLGEFSDDSEILRQNWQKAQQFAQRFWRRWIKEYLPTLCRRTKWFSSEAKEPSVGDIVIVVGEDKRNDWPKGKVLEVHRGRDKKIRSVSLKLATGVLVRPVSKIAILDVFDRNSGNNSSLPEGSVENSHPADAEQLRPSINESTANQNHSLVDHHCD